MNLLSQSMIEDIFCFSIFVGMEDQNILDQNHEEARNRVLKPTVEYGVIAALVMIAYTLVAYFFGLLYNSGLNSVITLVLYSALITWILVNYRKTEGSGFVNYGRALGIGTLTFVWAGIISAVFSYIFFAFIAPDFVDRMLEMQYDQMIENGMSEDMADMAIGQSKIFMTPGWMSVFGFLSSVFFAFIISLIVAAFVRKSPLD
ncbi:DUF4199 domain-containing protein [Halocola ammonii]